jgi:hypothetical protein
LPVRLSRVRRRCIGRWLASRPTNTRRCHTPGRTYFMPGSSRAPTRFSVVMDRAWEGRCSREARNLPSTKCYITR